MCSHFKENGGGIFNYYLHLILFTEAKVADKDYTVHKVRLIICDIIVSFLLHTFLFGLYYVIMFVILNIYSYFCT